MQTKRVTCKHHRVLKSQNSTYSTCVHAVTNSRDDTTDYEMLKREGAALENGTNRHDDRPDKYGPTAAKDVANEYRAAGPKETTEVVRGNCDTFEKRSQNYRSMAYLRTHSPWLVDFALLTAGSLSL